MKTFDVYRHPVEGYQAVKQGFGWPACLFGWLWAYAKRLWKHGTLILLAMLFLTVLQGAAASGEYLGGILVAYLAQTALSIFIGARGNDWRRENLERRGFAMFATLQASTPDSAVAEAARSSAAIE